MTEETRESYDRGEVVWVKLGSSWWPGEVKDAEELPSDVQDFKKPPLVIVKFFDEDSYEYVKSWTNIHPYDCEKKNEFIKKGMAAFRAKVPHMEKFPKDVLQAEEKVGGNPNILSNPMFLPEKKRNYAAEIFGTPSPKNNTPKNKKRSSTNKSGGKKDQSHITHRRFLGVDDYRAYILIQYPGKDRIPGDKEDEEVISINREPEQAFNCHSCSFSTKRLEVMILHTKSHIQGVYQASARRGKQSAPRRKKEKSKRARGSDVVDSDSTTSDSEPVAQKKRKPRSQGAKKAKQVEEEVQEEEQKKTDIRKELLEAWEESDDEDLDFSMANLNASMVSLGDKSDMTGSEAVDQKDKPVAAKSPSQTLEEVLNDVSGKLEDSSLQSDLTQPAEEQLSTEKLLSTLEDDSDADDEVRAIDDKKTKGDDKEDVKSNKKGEMPEDEATNKKSEGDEDPSQQRMNKDVQEAIKSCFDFDEDDEEDGTIMGKADSGRKIPRVIPKAPRKNSEGDGGEDMDAAFKELMEVTAVPELPDVQNSLKCEQNFHNIKTIKFPDKPEQVGSPPRSERKDSTEVATKLTNPKKRFVKSFEDFELMQNEIRRKEEEQKADIEPKADAFSYLDNSEEQDSPESSIELSKLKSKIMSKIIEEANINPESKSRIMSKIQDSKHKTAESELKTKIEESGTKTTEAVSSHRTPRSKILESYRKDTNKRKSQEEAETRQENQANVVPPKKSIWSRRGSHPKKDKTPFSIAQPPVRTASAKAVLEMRKQASRSRRQHVAEQPKPTPVINDPPVKDVLEEEEKPTEDDTMQVEGESPKTEELLPSNAVAEHSQKTPLHTEPLTVTEKSPLQTEPLIETERSPLQTEPLEETEKPPLKNESLNETEKSPLQTEPSKETEKSPLKNEPLKETEKFLPKNEPLNETEQPFLITESLMESEKSPLQTEPLSKSKKSPLKNEPLKETEKSSLQTEPLNESETSPLQTEPLRETEKSALKIEPLKETEKSSLQTEPLNESEKSPLQTEPLRETEKSALKIEPLKETERAPLQTEPLNESKKSPLQTEPLRETEKSPLKIEPSKETEKSPLQTEPLRETEKSALKIEPLKETERAPLQTEPLNESEKSPLQTEPVRETEKSPLKIEPSKETEKSPLQTEPLNETDKPLHSNIVEEVSVEVPQIQEATPEPVAVEEEVKRKESELEVENLEEPTTKEEIPRATVEEACEEPLEIDVGTEPCPEEVPVTREPVMEVKVASPPEEVEPPEEAVSSPKSRKRKLSELDPTHSPVKDLEGASSSDTETSAKKRMSEAEASPQFFEDFLIQTDKGMTAENKPSKDLPEDKEIPTEIEKEEDPLPLKDEVPAEEPMEVEQDKEAEHMEKTDKESDLDTKKIEEEVESKPEGEDPAQKEAAEKEKECLEMEVAAEKPVDPAASKVLDVPVQEHNNEVEIHCAGSSMDSFKFSIQTNLSILSSREEMSALALATLSEMKADLESNEDVVPKEEEEAKPELPPFEQPELVPIEGNLTVVSEKDLADGQVEITSDQVISPKRPATLSSFSLDFDSFSDSNSNSTTELSKADFNSKGTEFTAKALTKQMKKMDHKKESTYGRLELISILEGNSDADKKPLPPKKTSVVDDICDFEEHIPSQIVCAKSLKKDSPVEPEPDPKELKKEKTSKTSVKATTSKLLERLTTESKAKAAIAVELPAPVKDATPKSTRYIMKPRPSTVVSKPIVLPEKTPKPVPEAKPKPMEDIEDVEAFVIHKDPGKLNLEDEEAKLKTASKTVGKAKILQQTIITPAGEIIQPTVLEAQNDDNIFDINSMPIVLSDEIFTPESIEKMPIVIGSDAKATVKRPAVQNRIVVTPEVTPNKTVTFTKHKPPRILQTLGNKAAKNSPLLPNTAKPGKYIIVPQSSIPPTKYVPKKPTLIKKPPAPAKVPNIAPEPSGNKIMIVTNQQGQQQRLLLTPAQQKMLGYQSQKVTKTVVKSNVMPKSVFAKGVPLAEAGTSGIVSKAPSLVGQKVLVSASQSLIKATGQGRITKTVTKRSQAAPASKVQKTILIKDQHGQTVRKIQGTDDELLDKQVAEQLKAIKASSGMKLSLQQKHAEGDKASPKTTVRRSYSKRVDVKPRGPPPLAIQQSSKQETVVSMPKVPVSKKMELLETKTSGLLTEEAKPDRPLNQLVIQDAVGNQTTITEGQILALPSETVDGQPQSYMLVTLDESGNLTPLNSEALMSLDPNLGLGGDLGNMVLQIDQSALSDRPQTAVIKPSKAVEVEPVPQPVPEPEPVPEQKAVTPSTNGDPGQQLIVTGDPIATQKFLESLTEGTTDLANILANADGNSILIQADGQQILINTNTENQMLLSVNNEGANATESTEGGGNPIFATQPSKNQDILAAALADTDVFQQEHPSSGPGKIGSQLSPNNALYPMNVGSVLETSLTLSSPIMSPLELPSTNSKKIPDDEADILKQVPKNVDLPITITDPNISQTVANQQMMANELPELALPISESAPSTEMNSPSYAYSLPTLDDSGMAQKPFNGSMPLLTEDVEEAKPKPADEKAERFLSEEEGRFTLGGEMCSSLSEPPPEMFELPEVASTPDASDNASKDEDTTDASQADTSSEGSCEIPVQPQIVTKSLELSLKRSLDEAEEGSKKCKFD